MNFILILSGFNDDAIRVLSNDEDLPNCKDDNTTDDSSSNNNCPSKCPNILSNKQLYRMTNPPENNCHCHKPLTNCEEESFITDILINE